MINLSDRVNSFLLKQKRNSRELTEGQIRKALELNGLPPNQALIDFEKKYGGLILYSGLVTIEFGLIWGEGHPFNPELAIIEYEESEFNDRKFDIQCAKTEYQMELTLDENGKYYEDMELKHASFNLLIEELVLNKKFG